MDESESPNPERILQLQSAGKDYGIEMYDHAIDLFLTEFPDGTVRKRPRHADEHNYCKKQNESASTSNETPSSIVDLSLPSDSKFLKSEGKM